MLHLLDVAGAEFAANPWPAYAVLRAGPGLPYDAGFNGHVASRHADVRAIASDRRMVRNPAVFLDPEAVRALKVRDNFHDMPFHERFVQTSMLDTDGADHDRLRRAVFPFFTRSRLAHLRGDVARWTGAILDRLPRDGRIDFVADLAAPLPGQVIGRLIGTDPALVPDLTRWSDQVVSYFDLDRSPAKKRAAESATRRFHDVLRDLLADRRAHPRDDLASALLAAEAAGTLSPDETIATLMQLLQAGHGSTIDAMGNGMHALLTHPDQMALLRAHPDLMPGAVQEMFRHAAPLPFFHRYAAEDLHLCGRDWPRGTKFALLYAAANRDPAAFDDPDRFDATRQPNLHLGFGAGPHVCLGNNLARLTMETAFAALLTRFRHLAPAGPFSWKIGLQAHGPVALPLHVAV